MPINSGHEPPVRILVADDDAAICEALQLALEDEGYEVLQAPDGPQALEIIRRAPSRLVVLLDQLMPGLDGLGVLEAVSKDRQLAARHAYLLMTAGSAHFPQAEPLLARLSVTLIRKPFDLDALFALIAAAAHRFLDEQPE